MARQDSNHQSTQLPWMTWRELPLAVIAIPFMVLLGVHIAGFAMIVRKYIGIPYWLTFTLSYVLLIIPIWVWCDVNVWVLIAGTTIVVGASLLPLAFGWKEDAMEGKNFEDSAPAHILLILFYLCIPAIGEAQKALSKIQANSSETAATPAGEVSKSSEIVP